MHININHENNEKVWILLISLNVSDVKINILKYHLMYKDEKIFIHLICNNIKVYLHGI